MGSKKTIILIYLVLLILSYFIYKPSLSSYFFQDDWFTFKISQAKTIREFLLFFIPRTDVIYFRPLGMQVYFFIMRTLFGINPLFFRISTLLIYAFNGLLVYSLLLKFKLSRLLSFFGGVIYTTSVVTYIPFFWSATFPFVLGPTFFFLSFLFYISQYKKRELNKMISFIFFVCGLMTLEIIIVLPLILLVWQILYSKGKHIKLLVLYLLPFIPYLYVRLFAFPVPLTDTYTPRFSLLSTVRSYFLWSLNWPEEIGRQMVSAFKINQEFISNFSKFVSTWFITSLIIVTVFVIAPFLLRLVNFLKSRKLRFEKNSCFGLLWFFAALVPLLIFSNHTFPYYLPVPLFGLLLYFTSEINFLFNKITFLSQIKIILLTLLAIVWIFSSVTTMQFNQLTYWAPRRALQVEEMVGKAIKLVPKNSESIVLIESNDYKLPLNDQDAFHVLFGRGVKTFYEKIPSEQKTNNQKIIFLK